jgi:large subunit ribosomal protein L21
MQAVIKAGGKQYLVAPNQILNIDLTDAETKKLEFDALMVIDGTKISVGTPVIKDVKVKAEVIEEVKGDKLKILKFKPKKRVKKLTGHRQHYSQIKITGISSAKAAK